jgi:hypothetical protein
MCKNVSSLHNSTVSYRIWLWWVVLAQCKGCRVWMSKKHFAFLALAPNLPSFRTVLVQTNTHYILYFTNLFHQTTTRPYGAMVARQIPVFGNT